MTDLIDAPTDAATAPDLEAAVAVPSPAAAESVTAAHLLLAATLVGAAAIHLVMVPSHLDEWAVLGTGFIVSAWVQLALGVAVVVRPRRWVLVTTIVVSV